MLSAPLLKLPLLLSATTVVHNGTMAPTPRPKKDAVARFTRRDTIAGIVHWVPYINMTLIWAFTLCEVALIVASHQPSSPLAASVISILTFGSPSAAKKVNISPLFIVGAFLGTFGGALRIVCFRHLGRHFTYDLSIVDGHKLISDGPYAYVRHPSYTGWISLTVGMIIMLSAPGSWFVETGMLNTTAGLTIAVLYTSFNLYIISALFPRMVREDEVLKKEFGDQWVQWTKRTPYKIFPGIH
ncbi:Isoprenylcysteine carboxyl methyltransferase family-domain-containing protein [Trametes elegans]|nr:Isoprenylcysteine carboxyl methyltransferase family-domain-containing protein [Trametes elegans]